MQNKTKIQDNSIWRKIFRLAQWLIPVLIGVLLYEKFFRNSAFSLNHFIEQLVKLPIQWYVLLILFSFINWTLETVKWRILIGALNPLSFWKALSSILSGVAVSQLLPYKTGEYIGRLVYIRDRNKLNAALLSVVGSYSQLLVTLLFGMIGFIVVQPIPYTNYFVWSLALLLAAGFMFYYFLPVMNFRMGFKFGEKLQAAMGLVTKSELLKILGISFIRYCSFLLPYSLLALHYDLGLNTSFTWHVFAVSCIFFMQTVAPNFILTDIALRLAIPVIVFSKGNIVISQMDYVPGMIVYIFNVALPMVTGAFLIMFAKFKQQ